LLGAVLALFLYPTFAGPHASRASFVLLVVTAMALATTMMASPLLALLGFHAEPVRQATHAEQETVRQVP
jgi:hypothetical protein